jgi:hypothetical protein
MLPPGHRAEQRCCSHPLLQGRGRRTGQRRPRDGVLRPPQRGHSRLDAADLVPGELNMRGSRKRKKVAASRLESNRRRAHAVNAAV